MKDPSQKAFKLQVGDNAFQGRQNTLDNLLSQAERDCNKDQATSVNYSDYDSNKFRRPSPPNKRRRSETYQFRGRESIFKQPELPSPFRRDKHIPDFHKNPHKWTCYSLDDVNTADMSDKSNTQAALSFLNELKARKHHQDDDNKTDMRMDCDVMSNTMASTSSEQPGCSGDVSSKIVFKKPSLRKQNNKEQNSLAVVEIDESPIFRGSKIILPEYVVGEKPVNKQRRDRKNFTKVDRSKQIKLDHLADSDGDDDDDNNKDN